jgi:serine/threonine protein kinase
MNRCVSFFYGADKCTRANQDCLRPVDRELCLQKELEEVETRREEASREIKGLKKMLEQVEDEIYVQENEMALARQYFNENLQHIFFEYLPAHEHNYSHTIGPIDWDIPESDKRIGDFNIGRQLGDGSSDSVFICTHRRTHEQFALKKLNKDRYVSLPRLTRLEQELDVHALLLHPNIIKFDRVIHAPKHIYIVMELAYMDLNEYLHRHKDNLSLDTVREVGIGVLQGLQYLHDHGVAHLDIKQENILVSRNVPIGKLNRKHLKIGNFSRCEVQPQPENPIRVYRPVGTPGLMAPEIITDLSSTDGRSADMWSIGAILLWLVEGELSDAWMEAYSYYSNDSRKYEDKLFQCIIELYRSYQRSVDFELHDLICKLLVMVPSQRLTATQALHYPWLLRGPSIDRDEDGAWCRRIRHTI